MKGKTSLTKDLARAFRSGHRLIVATGQPLLAQTTPAGQDAAAALVHRSWSALGDDD